MTAIEEDNSPATLIKQQNKRKVPKAAPIPMPFEDIIGTLIQHLKDSPSYGNTRIHLKDLIKKKGLTYKEAADLCGIHYTYFQKILQGVHIKFENLPLKKVHKIALALDISIDELLEVSMETRENYLKRMFSGEEIL